MIKRLIGVGAALVISTMPMFANYITSTLTGFNGGENGGEFFSVTSANGSFYTFCIEKGEHFYPGQTYIYELNSAAVLGSGNHDLSTPGMDILSQGSAYLFAEFTKGTLSDY